MHGRTVVVLDDPHEVLVGLLQHVHLRARPHLRARQSPYVAMSCV